VAVEIPLEPSPPSTPSPLVSSSPSRPPAAAQSPVAAPRPVMVVAAVASRRASQPEQVDDEGAAAAGDIKTSFELQEAGTVRRFLDQCEYLLDDLAPAMPSTLAASSAVKLAEVCATTADVSVLKSQQLVRRLYDAFLLNAARHPVRNPTPSAGPSLALPTRLTVLVPARHSNGVWRSY
jgi:hypothetical protein